MIYFKYKDKIDKRQKRGFFLMQDIDIIKILSEVAFPSVVAIYCLVKINNSITKLNESILELTFYVKNL